jgi:transcriptional regulator with XRE-family HTH domain
MDSLRERLAYLIDAKGYIPRYVARKAGVTESSISNLLNNKTSKMQESNIEKLANFFHVSTEWLQFGTGEMTATKENQASKSPSYSCNDPAHINLLKRISELEAENKAYRMAMEIIKDARKGDPPEKYDAGDLEKSKKGKAV